MLEIIVIGGLYAGINAFIGAVLFFFKKMEKKKLEEIIKSYNALTDKTNEMIEIVSRTNSERSEHGVTREINLNEPYIPDTPTALTHRSVYLNDDFKLEIREKK
jgi:translation elongation factor EF-1alpha